VDCIHSESIDTTAARAYLHGPCSPPLLPPADAPGSACAALVAGTATACAGTAVATATTGCATATDKPHVMLHACSGAGAQARCGCGCKDATHAPPGTRSPAPPAAPAPARPRPHPRRARWHLDASRTSPRLRARDIQPELELASPLRDRECCAIESHCWESNPTARPRP
jgi:hypothetical protein